MEIQFKTKKLKKACNEFAWGRRKWGPILAKKVGQSLMAAQTWGEFRVP